MSVLLFTGYPGRIGNRLLPRLVNTYDFEKVVVLSEEKLVGEAKRRLEELKDLTEFEVLPADIRRSDLGLSSSVYERLCEEVNIVFHLAASHNISARWVPLYRVNVLGTEHMLKFSLKIKNLKHFVYFSSAYVSGDFSGVFYESDLDVGQSFKNNYERSKFIAEKLVREYSKDLPVTIFRPSIVVGDSLTGEIEKFEGPYFMLIAMATFPGRFRLPYFGKGNIPLNLIPADIVAKAATALAGFSGSFGKTYHLVDPSPPTLRELYATAHKIIRGTEPAGRFPVWLAKLIARCPFVKIPHQIFSYFKVHAYYDATNAITDLRKYGISLVSVKEFLPVIIKYILKKLGVEK